MSQVESVPELKSCPNPWCTSHDKSDPELFAAHQPIVMPNRNESGWSVACPVCPLQVPYKASENEAITTWNTRAPIEDDTPTATGQGVGALQSYEKFDGIGPHAETVETRASIGERFLECYDSALNDPLLKGYTPADCPSEIVLDMLDRLRTAKADTGLLSELVEAGEELLTFRVGELPSSGWLLDTDKSRAALDRLRTALAKVKAGESDRA